MTMETDSVVPREPKTDEELQTKILENLAGCIGDTELLGQLAELPRYRLSSILLNVIDASRQNGRVTDTRARMRALEEAVEDHGAGDNGEPGDGGNDFQVAERLAVEHGRHLIVKTSHTQVRVLRDLAIEALRDANNGPGCTGPLCPGFFNRDPRIMVQFAFDQFGNGALFELDKNTMGSRLADVADWYNHAPTDGNPHRLIAVEPWPTVVSYVTSEIALFPPVERILSVPSLLDDGSFTEPMTYYQEARLIYSPGNGLQELEIPKEVSARDVVQAAEFLLSQIATFPFDSAASRVHALVFGITPYVRDRINGPVPAWLVEAPNPRTGKGKLIHTALADLYGTKVPSTTEAEDGAEQRKKITASLRSGTPVIFIDNINDKIQGAHLASAITEGIWVDRELGESNNLSFNIRNLWVFSANNPESSQELAGRMVPSRLDSGVEFPDLLEFGDSVQQPARALRERSEIVRAKLIIVKWWVQNGMLPGSHRAFGSFEEWSKISAGILEDVMMAYEDSADQRWAAGFCVLMESFLDNRQALKERSDYESGQLRSLVAAWLQVHKEEPIRARDIVSLIVHCDGPGGHGYEINIDLGTANKEAANKAAKLARTMVGRVFDGYVVREVVRSNQSRFKLEQVDKPKPRSHHRTDCY